MCVYIYIVFMDVGDYSSHKVRQTRFVFDIGRLNLVYVFFVEKSDDGVRRREESSFLLLPVYAYNSRFRRFPEVKIIIASSSTRE